MGDKNNKRQFKQSRKQHLQGLQKKKNTVTLPPNEGPATPPSPPLPPPHLQNTTPTPLATSTPVTTFSAYSIITASAKKLDFSTRMELNEVENGNEYMLVEKNSCLLWSERITWQKDLEKLS
ncbi:hypothetical protein Pcinc_017892 [Petrolisthes cinctipes]|uniref:Uncharacterized protein n=1 Tax=Petrolisthes cinctipes TaxID=88211 RepID=A0AAE1FNC6_PETCI|nr:hypothetical protein Pcinc_017892 [Petrolisthes cinctipes]